MFWYRGAAAAVILSDRMEFSNRNLFRICALTTPSVRQSFFHVIYVLILDCVILQDWAYC